jgi:hypothetical protein
MEPEHVAELRWLQDEWSSLEHQALVQLKTGTDRKGYIARLQALVLPSFEDSWRYELLVSVPYRSKPALAVKTVWHRGIDSAKFANPVVRLSYGAGVRQLPTIEEFVAEVEAALVDDLCAKAATLKVPAFTAKSTVGLDGTGYQLTLGSSPVVARFEWWQFPPEGWEPLKS